MSDYWWDATTKEQMQRAAWRQYTKCLDRERGRMANDLWHSRLYANQRDIRPTVSASLYNFDGAMMTLNGVKAVSDTITARVARARILPVFQTDGGDFMLQRRAKRASSYVEAQFRISEVDMVSPIVAKDACVNGKGFVHISRKGKDISVDRVSPLMIVTDPNEAQWGGTGIRTLYRRHWVSKSYFVSRFSKDSRAYQAAQKSKGPTETYGVIDYEGSQNLVEVVEGWRLPDGKGKGGKHIVFTSSMLVSSDPWEYEKFPVCWLDYDDPQFGFWGQGVVQNLKPLQAELNYNVRKVQQILALFSTARVFLPSTSGINKDQFESARNQSLQIYPYTSTGGTPTIYAPNTVPPELFQHIQDTYNKMFELEGIPQLRDGKPSGITSGVAIREFEDLQQGRFALFSRRYENLHKQLAWWMMEYGRQIAKEDKNWQVPTAKDKYTTQTVNWEDVDMERDKYILGVLPASALPTSFGGRKDYVMEMMGAQLIDAKTAKKLIDFPDLDAHVAVEQAADEYVDWAIEQIIEGQALSPEPFQDAQLMLKRAQAHYNRLATQDVPEDIMQNLRGFMQATAELVQDAVAAQQGALPGGGPQPPPVGFDGAPPTAAVGSGPQGI